MVEEPREFVNNNAIVVLEEPLSVIIADKTPNEGFSAVEEAVPCSLIDEQQAPDDKEELMELYQEEQQHIRC
ncbi:hypothetical protein FRX31_028217 [Thalictrum thalictroides]|uniref:Uncharacterized protein n=1 Tax=Thalictrum thalictroides TaxID=46969 RepID=A0A7J6VBS3_THATH|nr:hypothetical protein FRX31_028217 [Thalictrum thalictroides]